MVPRIARMSPPPRGVVALAAPAQPLPDVMLRQVEYIVASDGVVSDPEKQQVAAVREAVESVRAALNGSAPDPEGNVMGVPLSYYRDLEQHDAPALAAELGVPILVLQGARDYQVTMDDFAIWKSALENKDFACLKSYPSLDHLFHTGSGPSVPSDYERRIPVAPDVIVDMAAWILAEDCP